MPPQPQILHKQLPSIPKQLPQPPIQRQQQPQIPELQQQQSPTVSVQTSPKKTTTTHKQLPQPPISKQLPLLDTSLAAFNNSDQPSSNSVLQSSNNLQLTNATSVVSTSTQSVNQETTTKSVVLLSPESPKLVLQPQSSYFNNQSKSEEKASSNSNNFVTSQLSFDSQQQEKKEQADLSPESPKLTFQPPAIVKQLPKSPITKQISPETPLGSLQNNQKLNQEETQKELEQQQQQQQADFSPESPILKFHPKQTNTQKESSPPLLLSSIQTTQLEINTEQNQNTDFSPESPKLFLQPSAIPLVQPPPQSVKQIDSPPTSANSTPAPTSQQLDSPQSSVNIPTEFDQTKMQSSYALNVLNKSDDEDFGPSLFLKSSNQLKTDNTTPTTSTKTPSANSIAKVAGATSANTKTQAGFTPIRTVKKRGTETSLNSDNLFLTPATSNSQVNESDSLFLSSQQKEIDSNKVSPNKKQQTPQQQRIQSVRSLSKSKSQFRDDSPDDLFVPSSTVISTNAQNNASMMRLNKTDSDQDLFSTSNNNNNSNNINENKRLDKSGRQPSNDYSIKGPLIRTAKVVNQEVDQQQNLDDYLSKKESTNDFVYANNSRHQSQDYLAMTRNKSKPILTNDSDQDLFNSVNNNTSDQNSAKQLIKDSSTHQDLYNSNNSRSQSKTSKEIQFVNNNQHAEQDFYNDSTTSRPQSTTKLIDELSEQPAEEEQTQMRADQPGLRIKINVPRQRWKSAIFKIRQQLRYVSCVIFYYCCS